METPGADIGNGAQQAAKQRAPTSLLRESNIAVCTSVYQFDRVLSLMINPSLQSGGLFVISVVLPTKGPGAVTLINQLLNNSLPRRHASFFCGINLEEARSCFWFK